MNAGIIECDRSAAVDEGEERPAGVIIAAVDVDSSGLGSIAAGDLEGSIMGKSAGTRKR